MTDALATKEERRLKINRRWHRVHTLEVDISSSTVWALNNRPNRLKKVRSQYDQGVITNAEFATLVINLRNYDNDIEETT